MVFMCFGSEVNKICIVEEKPEWDGQKAYLFEDSSI